MAGKKTKRIVTDGIAHIKASFNNTIVMITDMGGNALSGPKIGSPNLLAILDVGPIYLAISYS